MNIKSIAKKILPHVSSVITDNKELFDDVIEILTKTLVVEQRKEELTDEKIQKSVCVVFRMMGYSDDDIWEYMENCFDSVIWPWEYYSLLV